MLYIHEPLNLVWHESNLETFTMYKKNGYNLREKGGKIAVVISDWGLYPIPLHTVWSFNERDIDFNFAVCIEIERKCQERNLMSSFRVLLCLACKCYFKRFANGFSILSLSYSLGESERERERERFTSTNNFNCMYVIVLPFVTPNVVSLCCRQSFPNFINFFAPSRTKICMATYPFKILLK